MSVLTLLACVVFCASGSLGVSHGYHTKPTTVNYKYTREEGTASLIEQGTSIDSGDRIWFTSAINYDLGDEGLSKAKSMIDYSTAEEVAMVSVNGVCFIYTCDNPATYADAVAILEGRDGTTVTLGHLPTCQLDATGAFDLLDYTKKAELFKANPSLGKLCSISSRIFKPCDDGANGMTAAFPAKGAEADDETFVEAFTLNNKVEILVKDFAFQLYHPKHQPKYPSYIFPRYPSYGYRG